MLTIIIVPAQVTDHEADGVLRLVDQELLQHVLWAQVRRLTPAGTLVAMGTTCWCQRPEEAQAARSPPLLPLCFLQSSRRLAQLSCGSASVNAGLLPRTPLAP